MNRDEIESFKCEIRTEIDRSIQSRMDANFGWMKTLMTIVSTILLTFVATGVWCVIQISEIKNNYVTKKEVALKLELIMVKTDKINAKVDNNPEELKRTKEDERRIENAIIKGTYQMESLTRGGK